MKINDENVSKRKRFDKQNGIPQKVYELLKWTLIL